MAVARKQSSQFTPETDCEIIRGYINDQEAMFEREGVTIKRQTMCGWMSKCAFNLQPIVAHMEKEM